MSENAAPTNVIIQKSCAKFSTTPTKRPIPSPLPKKNLNNTNSARELATQAKLTLIQDRLKKVSALKEQRLRDKQVKLELHNKKKAFTRAKLNQDSEKEAENRLQTIARQKEYDEQQKKRHKDMLAASLEERAQLAADLEKEKKARRRISIFMSKKIRTAAQENEERLLREKKQQEIDLLTSRRIENLNLRQAKKLDEIRKRESFCNKSETAILQKQAAEQLLSKVKLETQVYRE